MADLKKALYVSKRQLSELVTDAVNLEGINITIAEVQTLLDGVSIGGHKISDVAITLNQSRAWKHLFQAVENQTFALTKDFSDELHHIAAYEEALLWGQFRDSSVSISGTTYQPPQADKLESCWEQMIVRLHDIQCPVTRAMATFLQMARHQFYFDVNKRMGRFMMNGLLLQEGYPVINVPAKKQLSFNQLMLEFYESDNMQPMMNFLISCWSEQTLAFMNGQ